MQCYEAMEHGLYYYIDKVLWSFDGSRKKILDSLTMQFLDIV